MKKTQKNKMYWEAVITDLPRFLEPRLSAWLFDHGCWGTQEKLDFTQPDLRYVPKVKSRRMINVSAYFSPESKEKMEVTLAAWLRANAPNARTQWLLELDRDWLAEWKKHFKAFSVAGMRILPKWEARKKPSLVKKNTIIIEPGMAFGTGTHATTRFAMGLLKKAAGRRLVKGKNVIDVGSGSGILAVAADKLGAGKVLAIDNDPEAWRECRKTFRLNKAKHCRVTEKQMGEIRAQFDIVVANIIDGVLMDLKDELWRATKPGGVIILSGILTAGANAFKKDFLEGRKGARVVVEISDEEWTGLLISK